MASIICMRSMEFDDGKIKLKRKLIKRADGCGYILNLPKFVGDFGEIADVEIDPFRKEIIVKL